MKTAYVDEFQGEILVEVQRVEKRRKVAYFYSFKKLKELKRFMNYNTDINFIDVQKS